MPSRSIEVTRAARYEGLAPASAKATRAAQGASSKRNTKPELLLRRALREAGLRGYRIDVPKLPGRPDVVFGQAKVAIFCDGDFWHGRDLEQRLAKLARGHNAPYWVQKISGNVARDRRHDEMLAGDGWKVLRYWESHVRGNPPKIAREIKRIVDRRYMKNSIRDLRNKKIIGGVK
jgi:DNA mismatch endonuclease (patch repair protein)